MTNNIKTIEEKYKKNIDEIYSSYFNSINDGINDSDNFITLDKIETNLLDARAKTEQVYRDVTSEILKNINEAELIIQKKRV